MKKTQTSLLIVFGLTILLLLAMIFYSIKEKKIKEIELEKTKKELFELKKINYMALSEKCIDENFIYSINEYGFEIEKIETQLKNNFITCISKYKDLQIEYDMPYLKVNVEENENIISVKINLNTKIKSEDVFDSIETYTYDFSKITFKNLKLENNQLSFDTKIISSDENAILYLKKGTTFSLNNNPASQISIKVDKKPEFSFIIGNFIYDLNPDGLKSDELMILKLKYKEDWLNYKGQIINPKKLRIAYLEENKKEWRFLPSIVNIDKKEIVIFTNHFSKYAIAYLESNTPIIEKKEEDIYIAGFYNGGIYSEEQAAITQNIKNENDINEEKCQTNNDFDFIGDINVKKKKINIPYQESGCIDAHTFVLYELEYDKPLEKLAVISHQDISIQKQKFGNKVLIYLSSMKKIDYEIKIMNTEKTLPKIDYPVYDKKENIKYCFSDKEYSAKASEEKYIHAGTDISTAGYVTAPCEAEIIDIWNYEVNLKCEGDTHSRKYFKRQPNEEIGVDYGATVVLKCTEYPIFLLYMHLNPEQLYIRNPDNKGDYRFFCLGSIVKKGEIIGEASDTGSSKGIHLHFETRAGEIADYGIPARKNAFNPAYLYTFQGLEDIHEKKLQNTLLNENCFNTFAITRGATEKELFPDLYS